MSVDRTGSSDSRGIHVGGWFIAICFFVYLTILVVFTFPLILHPGAYIIGSLDSPGLGGELFIEAHTLEKFQTFDLRHFFHTNLSFFPEGQDLRFHIGIPIHVLAYPILGSIWGIIGGYNILVLLVFALNGVSSAWFFRRRGFGVYTAFVAGLLFMLNPYFILKIRLGFLSKLVFFLVPFFIDAVIRLAETGNPLFGVEAGFLMSLGLVGYPAYMIYSGLGALVILAVTLVLGGGKNKFGILTGTAAGAAIFFPMAVMFSKFTGIVRFARYEPVFNFFTPYVEPFHFWRFFPETFAPNINDNFPVGIPICLILLWLGGTIVKKRGIPSDIQYAIAGASFVMLLLSFGPFLMVSGRPAQIAGHPVLMPYYYIVKLNPAGRRLGFPIRSMPFVFFFMEITALYFFCAITDPGRKAGHRFRSPNRIRTAAVIVILLLGEGFIFQRELYSGIVKHYEPPPCVAELSGSKGALLHIPLNVPKILNIKKLPDYALSGPLSGIGREFFINKFLNVSGERLPSPHYYSLLTALTGRPQANLLRFNPDEPASVTAFLLPPERGSILEATRYRVLMRELGVGTVVLHLDFFIDEERRKNIENILTIAFGQPVSCDRGRVELFETNSY